MNTKARPAHDARKTGNPQPNGCLSFPIYTRILTNLQAVIAWMAEHPDRCKQSAWEALRSLPLMRGRGMSAFCAVALAWACLRQI